MRKLSLFAGLALLGAFAAVGCGEGKTAEEIEAAKYPKVKPLTPEEEAKARELSKSRPPTTTQQSGP